MWSIPRIYRSLLLGTLLQLQLLLLWSGARGVDAHSQRRSPISYISLVENPEIRTPSQRIHHNSEFDITFTLHGAQQEVRLSLEPNHDIVPQGAKVEYLDDSGAVARTELIQRHEVKVFKGQSWVRDANGDGWTHAGWARVVVKEDGVNPLFSGAFVIFGDAHHIQLRSWYLHTRYPEDPELSDSGDEHMVVFRDSDVKKQRLGGQTALGLGARSMDENENIQCNAHNLTFNGLDNPIYQPQNFLDTSPSKRDGLLGTLGLNNLFSSALNKRQNFDGGTTGNTGSINLRNSIGQTAGCPVTKMLALAGIAVDCTYVSVFENEAAARQHIISQYNSA